MSRRIEQINDAPTGVYIFIIIVSVLACGGFIFADLLTRSTGQQVCAYFNYTKLVDYDGSHPPNYGGYWFQIQCDSTILNVTCTHSNECSGWNKWGDCLAHTPTVNDCQRT